MYNVIKDETLIYLIFNVIFYYFYRIWVPSKVISIVKFSKILYKNFNNYKKNHLPNVNFSPESGGSVKPNSAIDDISTHGTIKLKK